MNKLSMKHFILYAVVVLSLLLTACNAKDSGTSAKAENKNKTIKIGYINSTGNKDKNKPSVAGAEGWAIKQGYLKEELKKIGITNFEFYAFPNGPNLNEAMASGELDLGILGDTPGLLAKGAGQKTRFIGFSQIHLDIWLATNKKNGITKLEDLKGKKVATSNGSYMFRYLTGLLKENDLLDKVEYVHLLPTEAAAALDRNDIQAYAFPTYSGPKHVKLGFPLVTQASKSNPDLTGTSVTVVSEKFLNDNPDFVETWTATRKKSVKDLQEKKEDFYEYLADITKQDIEIVKASIPIENIKEESFPEEGLELLEGTKQFLIGQKLIKSDFDIKDWIIEK